MVGFWLSSEFPQMDLKQWVRKFSNRPTATEFLFAVWWIMRFWNSRVLWGEELWAMKDVQRFIENAILQCCKLQIEYLQNQRRRFDVLAVKYYGRNLALKNYFRY